MAIRSVVLCAAFVGALCTPALAQNQDAQFLDPQNEYFVAPEEYTAGWQYVTLARMLAPPSPATNGEAQFLAIGPGGGHQVGERFTSSRFFRTRVAEPGELGIGKIVFCPDLQENEVYHAPTSRREALQTTWWMATITDMSDFDKGEVTTGEFRVSIRAVRLAVR